MATPPTATTEQDDQLQHFQLTALDEQGVAALFASLGFPFYQAQLKDHGITGDILVHLDHEALRDVGIHSVGQRLAILRAVYKLKVEQNIPVEEGGWVPPSEDMEDAVLFDSPAMMGHAQPSAQMMNMLGERDDRIRILESEVQKLHDTLLTIREDVMRPTSKPPRPSTSLRSPTSTLFPSSHQQSSPHPHPLSNQSTLSRNNSTSKSHAPTLSVSSTAVNIGVSGGAGLGVVGGGGGMPDSPRSPMESPRLGHHHSVGGGGGGEESSYQSSSSSAPLAGPVTPTTPTAPTQQYYGTTTSTTSSTPGAGAGGLTVPSSRPSTASSSGDHQPRDQSHPRDISSSSNTTSTSHHSTRHDKDKDKDSKSTTTLENPYRSFRVTLEDPCYKVLPAALKKYKINDDWRQYALFICYGNTERCLAYDEKPLLLFQRLKESNNNPVFMLRHIKDIKSPIAVASAKHAARREKRGVGVGVGVEGRLTVNRDGVSVVQTGGGGGSRPTRLHHPPVLLPVGKDKESGAGEGRKEEHGAPPSSPREAPGYCISIYPYLAEREDEFDVTVGDTFVIISKTKGWWVVHRDLSPLSLDTTTPRKSAWVPAGCLLETSVPPLSLAPPSLDLSSLPPGNAATVPIEPQFVVSVSTPNVALMDYERMGADELQVKKGTAVRILKRYNHWSYAIKEDGQRGWIPSWFCGRASRTGDGTPTTPTTAEGRAATSSSSSSNANITSEARGLSLTTSSAGRERSTSSATAAAAAKASEEDGEATLVAGRKGEE